jgi:hypothetical protein
VCVAASTQFRATRCKKHRVFAFSKKSHFVKEDASSHFRRVGICFARVPLWFLKAAVFKIAKTLLNNSFCMAQLKEASAFLSLHCI